MTKPHILIVGDVGVGKSTLIRRLLAHIDRPVCGFVTQASARDADGRHSIYLHRANDSAPIQTEQNHVGDAQRRLPWSNPAVFDSLGTAYLAHTPDSVIVMDELGVLESDAAVFCARVLACLEGDTPVLAAVKSKSSPFLDAVKAHPNATVYAITADNRDALFAQLLPVVRGWG